MKEILQKLVSGEVGDDDAIKAINAGFYEDYGYAKIDYNRGSRTGFGEVIMCEGKQLSHITGIFKNMAGREDCRILATRASEEVYAAVSAEIPGACYNKPARTITYTKKDAPKYNGRVLVITAGTADIAVAEEAAETVKFFGCEAETLYDVGVAGIHRLLSNLDEINAADVIIVAAGMDGALPSVTAGLTDKPVIAVPTSAGYGAAFGGVSALLAMLNSCAGGVSVMNIDNGFGAGLFACKIIRLCT